MLHGMQKLRRAGAGHERAPVRSWEFWHAECR